VVDTRVRGGRSAQFSRVLLGLFATALIVAPTVAAWAGGGSAQAGPPRDAAHRVRSSTEIASPIPRATRHGLAILVVTPPSSFEQLMLVSDFRALARAGGAGLMTTKVGSGDRTRAAYLTLSAGAIHSGDGAGGLLASTLRGRGVTVCVGRAFTRASPGNSGRMSNQGTPPPLRLLGADRTGSLACDLGREAETIPPVADSRDTLLIVDPSQYFAAPPRCAPMSASCGSVSSTPQAWGRLSSLLLGSAGSRRVQMIVVSPQPSPSMERAGDEVTPVVMAEGTAGTLLLRDGSMHALTSDTTMHTGLVSNVDVAPTILHFFGIPVPSQMTGAPIRTTDHPAPFALHRLELDQRRIRYPLQLGEVAFLTAAGMVAAAALLLLASGRSLRPGISRAIRFLFLCGVAFPLPILAGGLLSRPTYSVAVPFIVGAAVLIAVLALLPGWPGPLGPFAFIGVATLVYLAIGATAGGRWLSVPLAGGTMFDGVRFYGIPNSFTMLLPAGALFVAAHIQRRPGFVLLFAAGLFAGFPRLGADLGGSITVFAAAGLWWALRTRGRIGPRECATVLGVMAAGVVIVLLANRFLPGAPTHLTRFVESGGAGAGPLDTIRHRAGTALRQVADYPEGLVPLGVVVAVLWLAVARPGSVRAGLALKPEWRDMLIALTASSIVALLANDTGMAAAAAGSLYALAAVAYPTLLAAERHASPAGQVGAIRRPVRSLARGGAE
jgi:hypothetical protein